MPSVKDRDLQHTRDWILEEMLGHAAFGGWTRKALDASTVNADLPLDMARRAFPGGLPQVADHFADWTDCGMLAELEKRNLETMRVREHLKEISELRQLIRESEEIVDDSELRELWDDAQFELNHVRLFGDLVLAAFFEGSKPKDRELKLGM